jgi:hypothetical protein
MPMRPLFLASVGLGVSLTGFVLAPTNRLELLEDPCTDRDCQSACETSEQGLQWCQENCGFESHDTCDDPDPEDPECPAPAQWYGCYDD